VGGSGKAEGVSLAQLKARAARLPINEQRELIAFLIARQTAQDPDFKHTLSRKIDDTTPSNWVELSEVQKRYSD
jgi:hypothetical protein